MHNHYMMTVVYINKQNFISRPFMVKHSLYFLVILDNNVQNVKIHRFCHASKTLRASFHDLLKTVKNTNKDNLCVSIIHSLQHGTTCAHYVFTLI